MHSPSIAPPELPRDMRPRAMAPPAAAAVEAPPDLAVEIRGLSKIYDSAAAHAGQDRARRRSTSPSRAARSSACSAPTAPANRRSSTSSPASSSRPPARPASGASISTTMPRQARAAIGVVPQELNIDRFFTPRELLELQAGLYGVPQGASGGPTSCWAAGPRRQGRRLCAHPLGRHAAAADGGEGDGARAAGAGARRADRRRRCRAAPAALERMCAT